MQKTFKTIYKYQPISQFTYIYYLRLLLWDRDKSCFLEIRIFYFYNFHSLFSTMFMTKFRRKKFVEKIIKLISCLNNYLNKYL